eukprot:m.81933 g.81933  ORF g.81933 m.81933 type:complete len:534 (-) comp12661_c0_seq1:164-1765(-)
MSLLSCCVAALDEFTSAPFSMTWWKRILLWDDVNLSGEHVWNNAFVRLELNLDQERTPSSLWHGKCGAVLEVTVLCWGLAFPQHGLNTLALNFDVRAVLATNDEAPVTTSVVERVCPTNNHLSWLFLKNKVDGSMRSVVLEVPSHFRSRVVGNDVVCKRGNTLDNFNDSCCKGMLGVVDHEKMRLAHLGHVVPPQVVVVIHEELITGGINDKFWHSQAIKVADWINDVSHSWEVRVINTCSEVHVIVVLKGKSPAAHCTPEVVYVLLQDEGIHYNWNGSLDALVYCSSGPCGPTTLAGTSNNKFGDIVISQLLHEVSHGVHGTHSSLCHRKTQQPLWLGRIVQKVVPGVGDDGILGTPLWWLFSGEIDWFVWHLKQGSAGSARGKCNGSAQKNVLRAFTGKGVTVITARDVHKALGSIIQFVWHNDNHDMPPDALRDILWCEPLLRGHVDVIARVTIAVQLGVKHGILVVRVRLGNVVIQCSTVEPSGHTHVTLPVQFHGTDRSHKSQGNDPLHNALNVPFKNKIKKSISNRN